MPLETRLRALYGAQGLLVGLYTFGTILLALAVISLAVAIFSGAFTETALDCRGVVL